MPGPDDLARMSKEQRATLAAIERFREHALAVETEQRRMVLRFAAIMCSCRHARDPLYAETAQHCAVHGSFMIAPDGRFIG